MKVCSVDLSAQLKLLVNYCVLVVIPLDHEKNTALSLLMWFVLSVVITKPRSKPLSVCPMLLSKHHFSLTI